MQTKLNNVNLLLDIKSLKSQGVCPHFDGFHYHITATSLQNHSQHIHVSFSLQR